MARPKGAQIAKRVLIVLLIVLLIAVLLSVLGVFRRSGLTGGVSATRLGGVNNDSARPFGDRVLYYDGTTLYCFTSSGAVAWKFEIGANAWYDCNDHTIAAWRGSSIYVIDRNGNSSYSDSLGETVQFARIGKQYVGIVVGESTSPRLIVKDHTGAHMDEESDAYNGLILTDLGFYGPSGQYMWTLALDIFGTAANTVLNTFEVGKMNTGEVSLGEPITYAAVYENGKLHIINTRKMRSFNDKGTEDTADSKLIYGWYYLCSEVPQRGNATFLFAPSSETSSGFFTISELRSLCGNTDLRYSLPETCVGAALKNGVVYALAPTVLYRANTSETRFVAYDLPQEIQVTDLIGTLTNGRLLVACGDELYLLTLP